MGSNNTKQNGKDESHRRRSNLRRILHISSHSEQSKSRPISYAGVNQYYEDRQHSTRPISMINVVPCDSFETKASDENVERISQVSPRSKRSSSPSAEEINESSSEMTHSQHDDIELTIVNKFNEDDWKSYIPLTIEKVRSVKILRDLIDERTNTEFQHVFKRLLQNEKIHEHDLFLDWFFAELEQAMHSFDDDNTYSHKPVLLCSIDQDRFDCAKYLLEYNLLPSKLDINRTNEQGRHCLLMLAHKNGPVDLVKYLLKYHLPCLDINKVDLNNYSSLHHACRHFNLSLSEALLPFASKQTLQIENSELRTPADYWLECLCSLKKLKPTHIQHTLEDLRLDYLLDDTEFNQNVYFLQAIINRGGQITKFPLRYIRSILPQLTFDQKLSYVDHHVNICCIIYKNRLSTLIHNYDEFKISIQASEILTEFIMALGTIQVEVQTRLAENACSQKEQTEKLKEHEMLQSIMRMLYGKFFRLFDCIYNNPDVNVKNFHFEHIFRHVWIYWKDHVKAFIKQTKEKNSSLKSICRIQLFKALMNYPNDIQNLPINSFLKQFISYHNQFFVIQRKF